MITLKDVVIVVSSILVIYAVASAFLTQWQVAILLQAISLIFSCVAVYYIEVADRRRRKALDALDRARSMGELCGRVFTDPHPDVDFEAVGEQCGYEKAARACDECYAAANSDPLWVPKRYKQECV